MTDSTRHRSINQVLNHFHACNPQVLVCQKENLYDQVPNPPKN